MDFLFGFSSFDLEFGIFVRRRAMAMMTWRDNLKKIENECDVITIGISISEFNFKNIPAKMYDKLRFS